MKSLKILAILLSSSAITLFSCKDKTTTPKVEAAQPLAPSFAEPAQNAQGLWHYTCIKGCEGGSGAAINCVTCGTPLAHNTAYHGNVTAPQSSAPFAAPTSTPMANPSMAEPAQNAAGIWHYTCNKGCVGGSGTVGNCGSCGGSLTHNVAYHQ